MPFAINHPKIADNDYAEFIISCIKKTVKQEDALVRQIVYTMLSAYSNNPLNLGIIALQAKEKAILSFRQQNLYQKVTYGKLERCLQKC